MINDLQRVLLGHLPFRTTFGRDVCRNFALDVLAARGVGRGRIRPLFLVYFATFRRSRSRDDRAGADNALTRRYPEVDTAAARRILRRCRPEVPGVGFTGGEPLLRDDIIELVGYARQLGYAPVGLSTNALLLPRREGVLEHVDFLRISLGASGVPRRDRLGDGREPVHRVLDRLRRYAPLQRELGFRIHLHCVLGHDNIDDVPGLLALAGEYDVRFSIAPRLNAAGMPVEELAREPVRTRYRCMMDRVIDHKKKTDAVLDIVPFLEHLRDFVPVRCMPELAPRVYPDGSFIHPCPNLCGGSRNMLEAASRAVSIGARRRQADRTCPRACFLSSYLQTSLLVQHPLSLLRELFA